MSQAINLYLDDLRRCPKDFALARSYEECIAMLAEAEVGVLSLDYNLGGVRTGYDVALWIVESGRWPREIRFHTSDSAGRRRMRELLTARAPGYVKIER